MKHAFLALSCLLILSGCEKTPAQPAGKEFVRPAKIAIATSDAEQRIRKFPGITEATQKTALAFRVGGQVVDIAVHAGETVQAGTLLARIDDSSYRATLADRQARYDLASVNLQRQKTLFEKKQVAKSRLDEAVSSFEAAGAALDLAREDMNHTRLLAPYDGVISRIDMDRFQSISSQQAVIEMQALDNIDVTFSVPEALFGLIRKENQNIPNIDVQLDSLPGKVFLASYREHETTPDTTTRAYKVTVSMPRPEGMTILPGMSATVSADLSFLYPEGRQNILIPMEAVFDEDGERFVWRLDDENIAHKTPVKVEGLAGENLRINHGLSEGDRIIAVGVSHVHEGQKVRPMTKERGL